MFALENVVLKSTTLNRVGNSAPTDVNVFITVHNINGLESSLPPLPEMVANSDQSHGFPSMCILDRLCVRRAILPWENSSIIK